MNKTANSMLCAVTFVLLLGIGVSHAQIPPIPARIGGEVTVDGVQLTHNDDQGYTFTVTREDGTVFDPVAEDTDGLEPATDWYRIDIPIFDDPIQPGGAVVGSTAVIHVYKDGDELQVISPEGGRIVVGDSGSASQVDLDAITHLPPNPDAGPDQNVDEGSTVTLDGSGSTDPEGAIVTYEWIELSANGILLSDPNAIQPTFVTPPVNAPFINLQFQLTVTNNFGVTASDDVFITVEDNGITGFPDDVISFYSFGENPLAMGIRVDDPLDAGLVFLDTVDPDVYPFDVLSTPQLMVYGLINFMIRVMQPGETVTLTVFLSEALNGFWSWFKYDEITETWIDYLELGIALYNPGWNQVTIILQDGGLGDMDLVIDSMILDPSGPGIPWFIPLEDDDDDDPDQPRNISSTSEEDGGCGCVVIDPATVHESNSPLYRKVIAFGVYLAPLAHLLLLKRRRSKKMNRA